MDRMLKCKDGNQKVIDRPELSFIPIAKDQPELNVEIYNADIGHYGQTHH